jgi:hypothetical protein
MVSHSACHLRGALHPHTRVEFEVQDWVKSENLRRQQLCWLQLLPAC